VLRTRLFEPLGMHDTRFWATDTSRLATAYAPTPGEPEVWDPPDGQWSRPPAFANGADGLVSTVDDLLAFARAFLGSTAVPLSKDAVWEMTHDQLSTAQRAGADTFLQERSWSFCQSVIMHGARAGAFGWDGGLGTSWLVDPTRDLVTIVLTQQLWGSPAPHAVHDDLQDAAYAAVTESAGS